MENEGQARPVHNDQLAVFSELVRQVGESGAREAARVLAEQADDLVASVLEALNPARVADILDEFPVERRQAILAAAPPDVGRQWSRNHAYADGSVGRLMDPPIGIFQLGMRVGETIEQLRALVSRRFITYGYVIDAAARLCGVLVMRDLLFADREAPIDAIMVLNPVSLQPEMPLLEAMRRVAAYQYPAYPVCDADGHIVGVVRGQTLFEAEAFEISAQAGSMVGVDKEEHLATPWWRSVKLRQPWLQLNLLTAFIAGAVVSVFEQTINDVVLLAVFVPVLASQAMNTGCQTLAVTLRGMTLGDLKSGGERRLIWKEASLGLFNGAMVGVPAALVMFALASSDGNPLAPFLAAAVLAAMIGSCLISGFAGGLVPLALQRLGADPVTASSILVTTVTDVVSIGLLLSLGAWVLSA